MVNYQNSKIYKLVNDEIPEKIYIGSTTRKLSCRLAEHKINYKKNRGSTSNQIFGVGKVKIILIKNCPCNNKEELGKIEREVIESVDCVNKNLPTRSKKQWFIDNKDNIKEKKRIYYLNVIKK